MAPVVTNLNWGVSLAMDHMDFVMRLQRILALSVDRAKLVIDDVEAASVLYAAAHFDPFTGHAVEELAEPLATVRSEMDTDIYILAGVILAGAYSAIEDFVRALVVTRFREDPPSRALPQIQRLKPRKNDRPEVGLYEALNNRAKNKSGLSRFEAILAPLEYGGKIDSDDDVLVAELEAIRHKFDHTMGRADAKFLDVVQGTSFSVDDLIKVPRECFDKYLDTVHAYMYELLERMRVMDGLPRVFGSNPVTSRDHEKWRPKGLSSADTEGAAPDVTP
jgi:hypothetical protein